MTTLNYTVGTKITNVSVQPNIKFVVTMVSDKKVTMHKEDAKEFWTGGKGKNHLRAYMQTKESFELNITEGRLVISE